MDKFSECRVDEIEGDKENIDRIMWWRHKEGK
jgi:hypothetical protein